MAPEQPILGDDGLVVRDSGIWATEKLYYLKRYLDIFSVGMKNRWRSKLYYVDLFAGPGRCRVRETGEEVDGSPLIALRYAFSKYFFFEEDGNNCLALKTRIKSQAPDKLEDVVVANGDCNDQIAKTRFPLGNLGLAFVDPTGISQLAFETIRKLAENGKIDLIINFPEGMAIRMNLHQYTQRERSALNRFMGSSRWQERYKLALTSFDQICREIANEYLENLHSLGYLALDRDWIPVRTNQNTLLYYLLFASKDPRGTDFWRKIKHINPHGQRELDLL
jgi:three-Cys-motif partner protein